MASVSGFPKNIVVVQVSKSSLQCEHFTIAPPAAVTMILALFPQVSVAAHRVCPRTVPRG